MDRRGDIREFLISRRAKVTPEQAGLRVTDGRPRRVPGLRREEVGRLAGVSADYYTQLERGDVQGASDSVFNAIARALRLDDVERLHLFDLATAQILRSEAGRDPHDLGPAELIEELSTASAEFRDVWAQHDVRLPATGRHHFRHPHVGHLHLVFEAAALRADPGLTLLLATADPGTPTETALHQLRAMRDGDADPHRSG